MTLGFKRPMFPGQSLQPVPVSSPILEVADFDSRDLGLEAGQIIRLADTGAHYVLHEETQAGIMLGRKEYVSPYMVGKTLEIVDAIDGDVVPAAVGTNFSSTASGGGTVTTDGTKVTCSTLGQGAAALATVRWVHGLAGGNWLVQGYFEVTVNTTDATGASCVLIIEDGTRRVFHAWSFSSTGRWTMLDGGTQVDSFAVNSAADPFTAKFEGQERFLEIYFEANRGCFTVIDNGAPKGCIGYASLEATALNRLILGDESASSSNTSLSMREVVVGRYS